jgi:ABC-type sugar transport system ATPase subunit
VAEAEAPFLELRAVEKRFGDNTVLRGIDLTVAEH